MSKHTSRRRKTSKSKVLIESPVNAKKDTNQMNIAQYFVKEEKDSVNDNLCLPEGSLPSPDDAALPCSTSVCSVTCKSPEGKKVVQDNSKSTDVVEVNAEKISGLTNKVIAEVPKKKRYKKPTPQFRNHQLTEFFPVRRSNRKTLPDVIKAKHKNIEDAILSGNEDGFEIKEFPDKGRGVVTNKVIRRGDFVLEYYGELIDYEEAKRREFVYARKENTGCYMYYFKALNKKYCIDATKESGRLGRLINHSKKGNLKTQPFYLHDLKDCPHLVFFACRDIEPDEELLYDYGDRSKQSLESHPWLAL